MQNPLSVLTLVTCLGTYDWSLAQKFLLHLLVSGRRGGQGDRALHAPREAGEGAVRGRAGGGGAREGPQRTRGRRCPRGVAAAGVCSLVGFRGVCVSGGGFFKRLLSWGLNSRR